MKKTSCSQMDKIGKTGILIIMKKEMEQQFVQWREQIVPKLQNNRLQASEHLSICLIVNRWTVHLLLMGQLRSEMHLWGWGLT